MTDRSLDVAHYLDAAAEASKRTRTVAFALVVASILMLSGLLNSLQNSWMFQRIQKLADPSSPYSIEKLATPASVPGSAQYATNHTALYQAMVRSYIENTFTIKVPLLGIAIDANDLAVLGGVSFVVMLIWLQFSLTREVDNMKLAFEEARRHKELATFYNLLAMRQVLTTPPMQGKERPRFLLFVPKLLMLFPLAVLTAVIAHDLDTGSIGSKINDTHTIALFVMSSSLWAFVLILTISCLIVASRGDTLWMQYWNELSRPVPIGDAGRGIG